MSFNLFDTSFCTSKINAEKSNVSSVKPIFLDVFLHFKALDVFKILGKQRQFLLFFLLSFHLI
jgi:hypothetical protein